MQYLRWLNTVLRAVSGTLREGACFKLDKQTWRRKFFFLFLSGVETRSSNHEMEKRVTEDAVNCI
jgi:hypothetical protein